MNIKNTLENYPDISFIDNVSIDEMQSQMVNDYISKYQELTGETKYLGKADPYRLILYACCLQLYQLAQKVDDAGKQGLLKYSLGELLENMGAFKGIRRLSGAAATVKLRFTLAAVRQSVILIPAGSRVTAGDMLYFETMDNLEIAPGYLSGEINARCKETGTAGNGYGLGELNILVDPIPFVAGVENITVSSGGSDEENDDSLAQRIFLAPASYSTAGPDDAYEYWTRKFDPGIEDVRVDTSSPGVVDVRFTLQNGELPGETVIEELNRYLQDENIRPLTDHVTVNAPDIENYTIDFTYYLNYSDRSQAAVIQENVSRAVKEYISWQKEYIGRDINPDKLRSLLVNAKAKRIDIRNPIYKSIDNTALAVLSGEANIIYGGIEND